MVMHLGLTNETLQRTAKQPETAKVVTVSEEIYTGWCKSQDPLARIQSCINVEGGHFE
jgi:hypothetical protein